MKVKFNKSCDHPEAVVTVTAGIARTVCSQCGYMTIAFHHLTCLSWPSQSKSAAAEIGSGQMQISVG